MSRCGRWFEAAGLFRGSFQHVCCSFALDFIIDTNQVLKMSWQMHNVLLEIVSQGPVGVVTEVMDKIMAF